MANKIRTLNFLPEIFQTPTNRQFLNATLDQLVNPPITRRIEGYIGSKFGYGINAKDYYVTEPNKVRKDYQLDPGVVFTKKNESVAQDFISYPGILDALKLSDGIVDNNDRLFESQFYSWDSFTNLDKIINYNQYYWLPEGPPAVRVSSATVFSSNDYVVTDLANGYNIRTLGAGAGSTNPTITLLRGGTYRFFVNQQNGFWIQAEPGTSGTSITQPNLSVRDIFGVQNNGAREGVVTFTVPNKNAQNEFLFPGNNFVDVVSDKPFSEINGKTLSAIGNIDGITSLDGLTVMFYNTGIENETGYVSTFYSESNYDVNSGLVAPQTITITETTSTSNEITCNSTANLVPNQTITFNGTLGELTSYNSTGIIYYVKSILSPTTFTVSLTLNGPELVLTNNIGNITANINQGLYDEGFTTVVNNNFYRISYVGDTTDPVIKLTPVQTIPTEQKITSRFGVQYIGLNFYKNLAGTILRVPFISAPLDTLYYQDGESANKVGIIKLIESNLTNTLNIETDVLGKKNFTSTNGVKFTNGLKVQFDGDVIPRSYLEGEYYVEGVGTAIELIPTSILSAPEPFTVSSSLPYDILPYDIGNYDSSLYIPVTPDYITIARNSINRNAWSRSNRWFHIEVINATAQYNDNPNIALEFAKADNKARRPIIEFYPNLKLFNSGTIGKDAVDFIDFRTTDAFSQVAGQESYYPDVEVYTNYNAVINNCENETSTTITVPASSVFGTFKVGQYITDSTNILPADAIITDITGSSTLVLTIQWNNETTLPTTNNVSLISNSLPNNNYVLFPNARIVFAADTNENVKNKIYVASFSITTLGENPVITLTEAPDGQILIDDQIVILRGYNNQGNSFYYDGIEWIEAQKKNNVNQAPLFDIFDNEEISFGNEAIYTGSSFKGNKLFSYAVGDGPNDSVLGFPIKFSQIDNLGDISFEVSINRDTFDYVRGTQPINQKVNTGYVYNYKNRDDFTRELGWQTAIGPSVQYQIFEFTYNVNPDTNINESTQVTFTCDIAALNPDQSQWPVIQVYNNNTLLTANEFSYTVDKNSTAVTILINENIPTVYQVLLLSDQVSKTAYYNIPINLNNNPLNSDIESVNIGDIRGQYQSIFVNNPNSAGTIFGSNNYRDLGNVVPYGNRIIQNSASLAIPGAFLRKQNYSLFNSLMFNSREYIKFKTLLVDTVNSTDYNQRFNPAYMLDTALDQITSTKNQEQPFFWSDMIPSKAPLISNTYTFNNNLDTSIYPLSRIYDFTKANYYGILVYLIRSVQGITKTIQLIKGIDYEVSADSPSLTITKNLIPNDTIIINEYNQTYASYIPNTPTKLGLYPATIPSVVLDNNYNQPTYFIVGHDGSYNKLYGEYDALTDTLFDFRDQVLLEFETRVYNNLKLNAAIPIQEYEVVPGFFRETGFSYNEWLQMYSINFLDWIGQNKLDFKRQFYNRNDEYTYNYRQSGNKINSSPVPMGYWRGLYEYFYDSFIPAAAPWELLGYVNQPTWWTERYGPAPYTSDNLILWNDLAEGIDWNNGSPVVIPEAVRPGLLDILPVDEQGNLVPPLYSVIGNFNNNLFQRDWKVGDVGPVELSYKRSSTYPFDLMKLFALSKPAKFFNLAVDLDNYKYNEEFNQYLVNDRSHLVPNKIEIYGDGIAKTSYINWIVDYEKQLGVNATQNIKDLLFNLDVRLVYRLAGFSDKNLLKFFVEKGTPNSVNASLLIPDESYSVLLYDNQPMDRLIYSGIIVQIVNNGFAVFGNSQTNAFFRTLKPINNGNTNLVSVENLSARVLVDYSTTEEIIPYGTVFYTPQEVSQFINNYGAWLISKGATFNETERGIEVTWQQMIAEFLYWAQIGWEIGSVTTLNPSAQSLIINQENRVVQPLTIQQTNFVLNQNLYPMQTTNLSILRDNTLFNVKPLNEGDTIAYGQFNLSNFEHAIVFDNITLFDDVIYNLITGLRQIRINVRGTKTAEWDGTVTASGFILNQDNIEEWSKGVKYTRGSIVKYKNKFWIALNIVQPSQIFNEREWRRTDYDEIQKGLLPNSSTRSFESIRYYNSDIANLEKDADQLSFSLIGYRPRDYLALADLTDITQVNVYKNLIKNKGTPNSLNAFKGAKLPQGGIDYQVYENWAIKSAEFGGVLNNNYVDFKLDENKLTGNPSIVSLTDGNSTPGSLQEVPIYSLYNYAAPIYSANILPTLSEYEPSRLFPDAGYVNYNDVKMSAYFYSQLPVAVNKDGTIVPIQDFYVRDYVWLANYLEKWQVLTPESIGQVINARSNINGTSTITFAEAHGLSKLEIFAIVNFDSAVDGYYIVAEVVNTKQVLIQLAFNSNNRNITGQGVAFKFNSQRVQKPSDINQLPLLQSEFTKNTVWVDENSDGGWAVYRKNLNYKEEIQFTQPVSDTFGSAVGYTKQSGYLISDASEGKVYRYTFNDLLKQYVIDEDITQDTSFGAAIAYAENLYAISQPTTDPKVYIYTINDTPLTDDFQLLQTINKPIGIDGEWGSSISLSDDTNWLYISAKDESQVHVYRKENFILDSGFFEPGQVYQIKTLGREIDASSIVIGQTYQITFVGSTDYTLIGAISNTVGEIFVATGTTTGNGKVYDNPTDYKAIGAVDNIAGIYFVATGTGAGTGTARQVTYQPVSIIDASGILDPEDNFGKSIATNHYGDTVVIGAPGIDFDDDTENWGKSYIYSRGIQNFEVPVTASITQISLAWVPDNLDRPVIQTLIDNQIQLSSVAGISINDPIMFRGTNFGDSGIQPNLVYYIASVDSINSYVTIKTNRSTNNVVTLGIESTLDASGYIQLDPLYVSVNGTIVNDDTYAVVGSTLIYSKTLRAGDIVTISGNKFTLLQELTTQETPRIGVQFGTSVDTDKYSTEILIGAPFALSSTNQEGAVYRYTNGGAKYGQIIGTKNCNVTTGKQILINGYLVSIPPGNATDVAQAINSSNVTNVEAVNLNGILALKVINKNITQVNQKLVLTVTDNSVLDEIGIEVYTQTQVVQCPHKAGATQFGTVVKFNEHDSFVASAPVATRFAATTFDFIDDENFDNDTIFDNNATQWVDTNPNAGAVYMFDYLSVYNESINNTGTFVYAQSLNDTTQEYGSQPLYGAALDFNDNHVVVGTPNFRPDTIDGKVIAFINEAGIPDWSVLRQSAPIVNISKIENSQIYSAETNNTLINLDYMDPLQGKLLGAVRQNIDVISNIDPAGYNSLTDTQKSLVWGADKVGTLWLNTTNLRYINYHQNDPSYNSQYWGTLFPGSDVEVYSWVSSNVPPVQYQGPGIVFDPSLFTVQTVLNSSNLIVPVYYFWVKNTGVVFTKKGKTLSDNIIASYIADPISSGISYLAPLLPNAIALYNVQPYVLANDSVFHIGYATGKSNDVTHNEFSLIRADFVDDFLPGFPKLGSINIPESLYDRMLDSLAGVDESGQVVPNPYLPKAVQSGILARPRQSFFYNRYLALKNYLLYANEVLSQFPIAETRRSSFLFKAGEFYDTTDYWEYTNWWAKGFDNNTKSALQVPLYNDLSTLSVPVNTIVTVAKNGNGVSETYRYDGNSIWTRIGLENGTIRFKSSLWDYAEARLGFGDNFFDTDTFDTYPSEPTRWIIRALNEQIYTNDLLIFRNRSLILLFEYIQSETIESQNFLPWLNKTSLVDVSHKIRELRPIEVFQSDNQDFLAGYLNEAKPYHVVIKEFLLEYTGEEDYQGNITDFDLPAKYNSSIQKFVSPQLVYSNPSGDYEYDIESPIWQEPEYNQWYQNRGVTITGQEDYLMTTLNSYLTLGSNFLIVNNSSGFPINGVIKIGNEEIGYSSVDREVNVISGLIRGFNGTPVTDHIPGENIFMDLPAVLVLDGGRGYVEPPKVRAVIDTTLYPEPIQEAQLEAVMSLDSVLRVDVIDPGQGYSVLPEIVIDPAISIGFLSNDIDSVRHTVQLYAPALITGDLVKYKQGDNIDSVGGLQNNQWYYINLLQSSPTTIVALYSNLSDAINDQNRIKIFSRSSNENHFLDLGAKASAISSAIPVRENITTLKFDRTTYNSQVIDWEAGRFYGAFFAGDYTNIEDVSSSSIKLQGTQPPVSNIYASSQGVVLEISNIKNEREIDWSSFARSVDKTLAVNDLIRLKPLDDGSGYPNSSGSTIGFYVGMPVKFIGNMGTSGIISEQTYYVKEIVNDTDFKISETENGSIFPINNFDVTSGINFQCFTAKVTDRGIISVNYPGIRTVTRTTGPVSTISIPLTDIGTGGTQGFYTNLPIFFTGNVFGGIIENETYYVTTVIDSQTFTMSSKPNPKQINVYGTVDGIDLVVIESTVGLTVNDPIIFNNMIINGSPTNNFGNIEAGKVYYISAIFNLTNIQISETINGPVLDLSIVEENEDTSALITSQSETTQLRAATGSCEINVSLPVSPGQVDGQLFTLYQTSQQYPNVTGTNSNYLTATINATLTDVNRICLQNNNADIDNMYVNMPFVVDQNIGNLLESTVYYIYDIGTTTFEVTNTASSTNVLTCEDTNVLYEGMPVTFSGVSLGGIVIGQEYYILDIIDDTTFTITDIVGGSEVTLFTDNGLMIGKGEKFIIATEDPPSGPQNEFILINEIKNVTLTQNPIDQPSFDVSYILGGYRVIVDNLGLGFAVNNTILISGSDVGGIDSTNDLTLTVNTVDNQGQILDVICSGNPADNPQKYYLNVLSANEFAVYSDANMEIPVGGDTLENIGFSGFTTELATQTFSSTNEIAVDNSNMSFNIDDIVIFTGNVFGGITLGQQYYIVDSGTSSIVISDNPGGTPLALSNMTGSMKVTKPGSFAFLPEPFYFNQSIVKYNNRVYVCVVSNNDDEFIFGKWELLDSGDRRLNALDRIIGYYQPTDDMPGVDLSQLVTGIRYPNSTYLGNPFEPNKQFELDTILNDQPFYPTNVNVTGILFDGYQYIAAANLPTYSALLFDQGGDNWNVGKLSESPVGLSDIAYNPNQEIYVMTSTNSATPIFRSNNGTVWTTNGYFTPYGKLPYDINPYDSTSISIAALSLNSVAYNPATGVWVAVGDDIVISNDTYVWRETFIFSPEFDNELFGVSYVETNNFTGFIAVGKGQRFDFSTGVTLKVPTNLILTSTDGTNWNVVPSLTDKGMYAVSSDGTTITIVGEDGIVYNSVDGITFKGVNETLVYSTNPATNIVIVESTSGFVIGDQISVTNSFDVLVAGDVYTIVDIPSNTSIELSVSLTGAGFIPEQTQLYLYPRTPTLRDIIYTDNQYVAIGNLGHAAISSDGIRWESRVTGVDRDLLGLTYVSATNTIIAVGNNNTIIASTDNGNTWVSSSVITVEPTLYDVVGSEFMSGYGPEELVPGIVSDNLTMIVTTRPGTNWPVDEYQHTGYNVVSVEKELKGDNLYSFAGLVETVAQVAVFLIDDNTGLSTSLYNEIDYTVDWMNYTISLVNPLFAGYKLRIDAYEIGNGYQLVKSSTVVDPLITNNSTDFKEIVLNANYSAPSYAGGGVIRPGTGPLLVEILETNSLSNAIICSDISNFVLNEQVKFVGNVFGNIVENKPYYVKSISNIDNSITISESQTSLGVAGPIFNLADGPALGQGPMTCIIQVGSGLVWTDPIVYHNGQKLILGKTNTVLKTNSTTNSITTISSAGLAAGNKIVFSKTMFGSDINGDLIQGGTVFADELIAGRSYQIIDLGDDSTDFTTVGAASNNIGEIFVATGSTTGTGKTTPVFYVAANPVNGTEFKVSAINGGPVIELADAVGSAVFISNDYSIDSVSNSVLAKVIFARQYDATIDYLTYAFFGEMIPQYGYTIPETDIIEAAGSTTYSLLDYINGDNPENAIVEVNGLRLFNTEYTIDPLTETIEFTGSIPTVGDNIVVTTFNDTQQQYLNTTFDLSTTVVTEISDIFNNISPPTASTVITETTSSNLIVATSTAGFEINQTIIFKSNSISAEDILNGREYQITELGDTDWTTLGATADPVVGEIFTATDSGTPSSGTGKALPLTFGSSNIRTDGTVYYVLQIVTETDFTITDIQGSTSEFNTGVTTSQAVALVGGLPAVRVRTITPHQYATNNLVRIDGTGGSLQLNNNYYYVHVINGTEFDLYQTPYSPALVPVLPNNPVTNVSSYTLLSGGYTWLKDSFSVNNVWQQTNVDRLWVTINGYRVPSSKLRINENNELSILNVINVGDELIITSMVPSATPSENVYMLNVNKDNEGSVYRVPTNSRTFLTKPIYELSDTIYVNNVNNLITKEVQSNTVPVLEVDGTYSIGLVTDKEDLLNVVVYNVTKNITLSSGAYRVEIENLAPVLKIIPGSYINQGDELLITCIEGGLIYINGEQIRFTSVDLTDNSITGIQRGVNNTGAQFLIPAYLEVYSILPNNKMTDVLYNTNWNSNVYNIEEGDPLQISLTAGALFLRSDNT